MLTLAALAAATFAGSPAEPPRACQPDRAIHTRDGVLLRPKDLRAPQGIQPLGRMPPADLELAVYRKIDGCPIRVVAARAAELAARPDARR